MGAPDLPNPIDKFVAVVNRGDTEAFLSFFTEDGIVDDWGRRFAGRDAIRRWSDKEFIGAKGRMTVKNVEPAKNKMRVIADWKSNFYSGLSAFEFVLAGNLLKEMRIREA